jgi:hypothetical protein
VTDDSKAELPQESAPAISEGENTPESPQGGEYVPAEDVTDKVQQRINRLTYEKHEERRRAQELEARLQELETKVKTPAAPKQELTLEQFDYDQEKFSAALIEQRATEIVESKLSEQAQQQTAQQQKAELQAKQATYNKKALEYAEKNPEYTDLWNSMGSAIQSEAVAEFLMDSDIGPQMQHHLLKNFDQLQSIQSLPPMAQAAQLGRLEAKLSMPPVKPMSNAPDPAETLDGGIANPDQPKVTKGARMPL